MSPASSVSLEIVRVQIELAIGVEIHLLNHEPEKPYHPICPDYGGRLRLRCYIFAVFSVPIESV
jgi:hypothetical protein